MKILDNLALATPLFQDWEETIIWSCLQGVMGKVFVDDSEYPQSALAKLGKQASFGFLAGQPNIELVESCRNEDIILVPQHKDWADLIEKAYGTKAQAFTRYATKKDTRFNPKSLQYFVTQLPEGFGLKEIDEECYDLCLAQEWSQDLVANYDNYQHYDTLGLGFVVLYQGKVVAGASSYSSYKNGIEIEIDTHHNFRRLGLAKVVAAKLILACLDKELYPSWDAHSKISLELAKKLGYEFSHEYIAYEMDW